MDLYHRCLTEKREEAKEAIRYRCTTASTIQTMTDSVERPLTLLPAVDRQRGHECAGQATRDLYEHGGRRARCSDRVGHDQGHLAVRDTLAHRW